jgi:hypothetical protein
MINKIFLAFSGWGVNIKNIEKIAGIELFNLKDIDEQLFVNLIQKKIKPFNKNVIRNNKDEFKNLRFKESYSNSDWGILLPDYFKDERFSLKNNALYLMKLFSGEPLHVMFSVGNHGVEIEKTVVLERVKARFHKQDKIFFDKKFVNFYKIFFPVIDKAWWWAPDVAKWNLEDWRLHAACVLFEELGEYYGSKKLITWQSECADIVSLYENLFSRWKNDGGAYRVTQRINVILGKRFNNQTKKDLKDLYNYRNEFVHGSFFERLKENTKLAQLPMIDMKFLEEQANMARKVFIIYLCLTKEILEGHITGKSASHVIHDGILDIELRKKIEKVVNKILKIV